jgi:hypothetical protein
MRSLEIVARRSLATLIAAISAHKRRLGRLTALGGVLVVGSVLLRGTPRPVEVEFDLGPEHREFVEVRVAYLQDGEELHGVAFSFPEGAPGSVRHSVKLPEGDFEVRTELRPVRGSALASVGKLHAPSDGRVRIRVATDSGVRSGDSRR